MLISDESTRADSPESVYFEKTSILSLELKGSYCILGIRDTFTTNGFRETLFKVENGRNEL